MARPSVVVRSESLVRWVRVARRMWPREMGAWSRKARRWGVERRRWARGGAWAGELWGEGREVVVVEVEMGIL